MLVLSRKNGETIEIGDDIKVVIVRIGPNSVRVGIEAQLGVKILRSELVSDDDRESRDPTDRTESD